MLFERNEPVFTISVMFLTKKFCYNFRHGKLFQAPRLGILLKN